VSLAAPPEPAPVTVAVAEPAQVVAAVPAFPDLKLQGVIFSTVRPSAIINGRMVRQNERMSGALVLEISRSNVVVEYQNQRKTLSLRR
jgi:type II secretory pathway component PulC